jgi:hypothetical protein
VPNALACPQEAGGSCLGFYIFNQGLPAPQNIPEELRRLFRQSPPIVAARRRKGLVCAHCHRQIVPLDVRRNAIPGHQPLYEPIADAGRKRRKIVF